MVNDLRCAARNLARMRGAAVIAVLTLALGIGATTTMFSVVYAALLRPLPFAGADRLVMLYVTGAAARSARRSSGKSPSRCCCWARRGCCSKLSRGSRAGGPASAPGTC